MTKYPEIRYASSGLDHVLNLHLFDGTCRNVEFRSDEEMLAALKYGRALVDCIAIEYGILPRGAKLVSVAVAADPRDVLAELSAKIIHDLDPLDVVRLRFSQKLIVDHSELIDEMRDAKVRANRPGDARRYEELVDALERAADANECA